MYHIEIYDSWKDDARCVLNADFEGTEDDCMEFTRQFCDLMNIFATKHNVLVCEV